jgi:hypothetical protein
MCRNCWQEYYDASDVDNIMVRYLARCIRDVYELAPAGGHLHVALDDWNLGDDQDWSWYEDWVAKDDNTPEMVEECFLARRCLSLLRVMSEAERASALALYDGYWGSDIDLEELDTSVVWDLPDSKPGLKHQYMVVLDNGVMIEGQFFDGTAPPMYKHIEFIDFLDGWRTFA